MIDYSEPIELDQPAESFETEEDRRRKIEEPPPVRLVSIDDCFLWAPAGLEKQLDEFYVDLLKFEREETPADAAVHELVYRAENFRVRIEVVERPLAREDFRPLTLVVELINDLAHRLTEANVDYHRQRGLVPGQDDIFLNDPAGNPVLVGEYRVAI